MNATACVVAAAALLGGSCGNGKSLDPEASQGSVFAAGEGECSAEVEFCNRVWPASTTAIECKTIPEDLAGIACFRQLEKLSLYEPEYEDYPAIIRAMPRIPISDISELGKLDELKHVTLAWTQVADLRSLASLAKLTHIDLSYAPVRDITPLEDTKLRRLSLGCTRVADVTSLAEQTELWKLDLGGTLVRDLAPLAGLSKLKELDLSQTQVTDLRPLANLQLKVLNLTQTPVEDLSPLREMSTLEELHLDGTRVRSLEPLESQQGWLDISISHTPVTAAQIKSLQAARPHAQIRQSDSRLLPDLCTDLED